jgi:hypothetical protein
MRFPRGRSVLENAKLTFLNLDNILNAAKRERASKISGYVAIIYPDHSEFLFLKKGEAINAAFFSPQEKKVIPIGELVERARKGYNGVVSIYEVEEELISMILTALTSEPIYSQSIEEGAESAHFLKWLEDHNPTGFVQFSKSPEMCYVVLRNGKLLRGYIPSRQSREISPEEFAQLVSQDGGVVEVYKQTPQEIEQASPALTMLFLKMHNRLIEEFMEAVGPTLVKKFLNSSKKETEKEFSLIREFTVDKDVKIAGQSLATPEELTKSFARWIAIFLESFDSVLGPRHEEIVKRGIKDYRFAVKSTGFFDLFGLSRYFE